MKKTENIDILTGDPKLAIRKLAVPTMLSMVLIIAYNLADTIWVAGLGPEPLAALGFIAPLFFILVGFGNGIGAAASSTIARSIGAKNKQLANNNASHSIILTLVTSIIIPIIIIMFLDDILILMRGSGAALTDSLIYGNIIFAGMFFMIFPMVLSSILRAEGDVKRPMYSMIATAILNIVLNPIFIYVLGWGVAGAAWASILSSGISALIMSYWIWVKKDTYLRINYFKFNFPILKNILNISLPATSENILMSLFIVYINMTLTTVGGTVAVACYASALKVNHMTLIPLQGISTALLTVAGASFGACDYDKLKTAYDYSNKIGIIISIILVAITIALAPEIARLFSYTAQSASLEPKIASIIQIFNLFAIVYVWGNNSTSMFQGIGKGFTSLIITFGRTLFVEIIFIYLFTYALNMGEFGVYLGIIVGCLAASVIALIYSKYYLSNIRRTLNENQS